MAVWQNTQAGWLAQRGHLFPWVPVAMACGIGIYFSVLREPAARDFLWVGGGGLVLAGVGWRAGAIWAPLCWAVALVALGFCLAGLRAHQVDGPVLGWRYYGPVEGRIVGIDRSGSDALRLTLDRVVLRDVAPDRTPTRVRVSLHGGQGYITPEPGLRVILTGHLSPPSGPVEPGGFDFQRHSWFKRLGAVGYTRTPVLAIAPPQGGQWLFAARMALSARVQTALPGETGAFAAAIMTGDRSGMGKPTLQALRISNLAHLLAISGLHMGLLAGFVFTATRFVLAAVPVVGLRVASKKLAAVVALIAGACYLGLSGGNVATERAFVMAAVMLIAVIADRRALSLRAVALAAIIVLALRPEALLGPGFQMSFAATSALVAVFGYLRKRPLYKGPDWLRPVAAVVTSSFVAGLATAPFAAAHFNQIAHFGLVANLLSVPLMGVLVMPAAVLAACLLPVGLEGAALWVMGLGLDWILGVAHYVSSLDGARGMVVSPAPHILPLLALGALVVILWQGRARVIGMAPIALAFVLWGQTERPDVLISEDGALVGVMTGTGRALNRERGAGFVALNWLENDGDAVTQDTAFERWDAAKATGWPILTLRGKRAALAQDSCDGAKWVVMNVAPQHDLPCEVLHPKSLRASGAIALYRTEEGVKTISARQITGTRLWTAQ